MQQWAQDEGRFGMAKQRRNLQYCLHLLFHPSVFHLYLPWFCHLAVFFHWSPCLRVPSTGSLPRQHDPLQSQLPIRSHPVAICPTRCLLFHDSGGSSSRQCRTAYIPNHTASHLRTHLLRWNLCTEDAEQSATFRSAPTLPDATARKKV